jgi:hypothetical protein
MYSKEVANRRRRLIMAKSGQSGNILLSTDWHLDDNPRNEYRWQIFDHVMKWVVEANAKGTGNPVVYMLGDLTDRKDRHSAALVNRLIAAFMELISAGASIWILLGNHDKPLNGTPFWQFLDNLSNAGGLGSGITFVTRPYGSDSAKLLLLPYSDDPASEWADIDFSKYRAAFMHQTVTGALGNNGISLTNEKMADLPKKLKVYSGDIHTEQSVANVKYIGAPHPVAFGDDYPCQMIELNSDYEIARRIKLPAIQKLMIRIDHPDELKKIDARRGDQARVICKLSLADAALWPAWQDTISAWAASEEVILFSVEAEIEAGVASAETDLSDQMENEPEYILRLFADAEEIDDRMFATGVELLKEVSRDAG